MWEGDMTDSSGQPDIWIFFHRVSRIDPYQSDICMSAYVICSCVIKAMQVFFFEARKLVYLDAHSISTWQVVVFRVPCRNSGIIYGRESEAKLILFFSQCCNIMAFMMHPGDVIFHFLPVQGTHVGIIRHGVVMGCLFGGRTRLDEYTNRILQQY